MKDLHTENGKTLMKETAQTQINRKIPRARGWKEYRGNVHSTQSNVHIRAVATEIPMTFSTETEQS